MGSFHHFPTPSPSPLLAYPHLHHFCNKGVLEIRLVLKSSILHNIYQPPVHLVLKFSCLATYFFLCHVMYCCRQCLLQEVKKGKGVANFRLVDFWNEQFIGCFYSSSKFEFGALNERTWIIECLASIDFFFYIHAYAYKNEGIYSMAQWKVTPIIDVEQELHKSQRVSSRWTLKNVWEVRLECGQRCRLSTYKSTKIVITLNYCHWKLLSALHKQIHTSRCPVGQQWNVHLRHLTRKRYGWRTFLSNEYCIFLYYCILSSFWIVFPSFANVANPFLVRDPSKFR